MSEASPSEMLPYIIYISECSIPHERGTHPKTQILTLESWGSGAPMAHSGLRRLSGFTCWLLDSRVCKLLALESWGSGAPMAHSSLRRLSGFTVCKHFWLSRAAALKNCHISCVFWKTLWTVILYANMGYGVSQGTPHSYTNLYYIYIYIYITMYIIL